MSDLVLVLDAVEDARRVLTEYLEPGPRRPPNMTISMLVTLLGRHDVVAATKRLRTGPDLCVVK
jgi:CheY-like chemotaxis protein